MCMKFMFLKWQLLSPGTNKLRLQPVDLLLSIYMRSIAPSLFRLPVNPCLDISLAPFDLPHWSMNQIANILNKYKFLKDNFCAFFSPNFHEICSQDSRLQQVSNSLGMARCITSN